ncbi:protein translocase subunit SecD [Actinomycetota bacterium]
MSTGTKRTAQRTLALLAALILGLAGLLVGANIWGTGERTPKLGLDLEGGTQMILEPVLVGTDTVSSQQLNQARDIITQRVDANGVAGAEVTTQGGRNIVVSMPGVPDKATEDAIRKPSQLRFRPVLIAQPGTVTPEPTATTGATSSPTSGTASPTTSPKASVGSASPTTAKGAVPQALSKPAATTATSAPATSGASATAPAATGATTAPATASPTSGASTTPKDAYDTAWVTDALAKDFMTLDCAKQGDTANLVDDPKKPLVTCDADGQEKYILGPVVVEGDKIRDAAAGYKVLPNGQQSNEVVIDISFNGDGTKTYGDVSKKMVGLQDPNNRLATVLDKKVLVAPYFQSAITNGQAQISGNFQFDQARDLANQLKFGALPLSFQLQTRTEISPTLGSEQLRWGLVAGLIGLALVVAYSLFQYHALGFVTIASLVIAGLLTYLSLTLLGWSHNLRLDMAGVTGIIVSIGVTADSFIVYFERIRDEVREGRPLVSAVEAGWARAKRTILAADAVNFLAAGILYFLAASNVRGFAFTLGLTTLIDLLIVVLFTHPVVSLLARSKFFGSGHRWSGLDPERLGAKIRYAGRGRVTIADRRAASADGSAL